MSSLPGQPLGGSARQKVLPTPCIKIPTRQHPGGAQFLTQEREIVSARLRAKSLCRQESRRGKDGSHFMI